MRFLPNLWGGGFARGCEAGLAFGDADKFVWEGGAGRAPQVRDTWGLCTVTCAGPQMPHPAHACGACSASGTCPQSQLLILSPYPHGDRQRDTAEERG